MRSEPNPVFHLDDGQCFVALFPSLAPRHAVALTWAGGTGKNSVPYAVAEPWRPRSAGPTAKPVALDASETLRIPPNSMFSLTSFRRAPPRLPRYVFRLTDRVGLTADGHCRIDPDELPRSAAETLRRKSLVAGWFSEAQSARKDSCRIVLRAARKPVVSAPSVIAHQGQRNQLDRQVKANRRLHGSSEAIE